MWEKFEKSRTNIHFHFSSQEKFEDTYNVPHRHEHSFCLVFIFIFIFLVFVGVLFFLMQAG